MSRTLYLFLLGLILVQIQTATYDLVLLPQENGQACLDGSPPGIYVHEGSGSNTNKFMIYFEGGGFCGDDTIASTIESCYQRSMTSLGTSTVYADHHSFDGQGILSTKPQQNQIFHDWNKIYVIYCDGSAHQGYRESTISYKGKQLHFRGARNSKAVFEYLSKKYDFYNQDTIVITGVSAGGLGTYEWTNYLHENTVTSKVFSIPDSGMFITDFYSPVISRSVIKIRTTNLLLVIGVSEQDLPEPVEKCLEQRGDIVQCFNPANYAKYLQPPILIINSPYDEWAINNIIVAKCLQNRSPPYSLSNCNDTTRAVIEDYRNQSIKLFNQMKNDRSSVGMWGPACVQHGFSIYSSLTSTKFRAPNINGITLTEAIKQFLENPSSVDWLLDTEIWPGNSGCSGITSNIRAYQD